VRTGCCREAQPSARWSCTRPSPPPTGQLAAGFGGCRLVEWRGVPRCVNGFSALYANTERRAPHQHLPRCRCEPRYLPAELHRSYSSDVVRRSASPYSLTIPPTSRAVLGRGGRSRTVEGDHGQRASRWCLARLVSGRWLQMLPCTSGRCTGRRAACALNLLVLRLGFSQPDARPRVSGGVGGVQHGERGGRSCRRSYCRGSCWRLGSVHRPGGWGVGRSVRLVCGGWSFCRDALVM
jgi:hypothetical protein